MSKQQHPLHYTRDVLMHGPDLRANSFGIGKLIRTTYMQSPGWLWAKHLPDGFHSMHSIPREAFVQLLELRIGFVHIPFQLFTHRHRCRLPVQSLIIWTVASARNLQLVLMKLQRVQILRRHSVQCGPLATPHARSGRQSKSRISNSKIKHAEQFILNRSLRLLSFANASYGRQFRSNFVAFNYFAEIQKLKPFQLIRVNLSIHSYSAIGDRVRHNLNSVFGKTLAKRTNIRPPARALWSTRFLWSLRFHS